MIVVRGCVYVVDVRECDDIGMVLMGYDFEVLVYEGLVYVNEWCDIGDGG